MARERSIVPLTVPPQRVEDVLREFEKSVGGREVLQQTLQHGPTEEISYVLNLIADPRNDHKSLAKICALGGISIDKLLQAYRQSGTAEAQQRALQVVWKKLPHVAAEVMENALTRKAVCVYCDGFGEFKKVLEDLSVETKPCNSCSGRGFYYREGDFESQKLALELGGLVNKKVTVIGTQNNLNQQNNTFSVDDARAFRLGSDKLLFPNRFTSTASKADDDSEVVDAEISAEAEE